MNVEVSPPVEQSESKRCFGTGRSPAIRRDEGRVVARELGQVERVIVSPACDAEGKAGECRDRRGDYGRPGSG